MRASDGAADWSRAANAKPAVQLEERTTLLHWVTHKSRVRTNWRREMESGRPLLDWIAFLPHITLQIEAKSIARYEPEIFRGEHLDWIWRTAVYHSRKHSLHVYHLHFHRPFLSARSSSLEVQAPCQ